MRRVLRALRRRRGLVLWGGRLGDSYLRPGVLGVQLANGHVREPHMIWSAMDPSRDVWTVRVFVT